MSVTTYCEAIDKENARVGHEWSKFLDKYGTVFYADLTDEGKRECDEIVDIQCKRIVKLKELHKVKHIESNGKRMIVNV